MKADNIYVLMNSKSRFQAIKEVREKIDECVLKVGLQNNPRFQIF